MSIYDFDQIQEYISVKTIRPKDRVKFTVEFRFTDVSLDAVRDVKFKGVFRDIDNCSHTREIDVVVEAFIKKRGTHPRSADLTGKGNQLIFINAGKFIGEIYKNYGRRGSFTGKSEEQAKAMMDEAKLGAKRVCVAFANLEEMFFRGLITKPVDDRHEEERNLKKGRKGNEDQKKKYQYIVHDVGTAETGSFEAVATIEIIPGTKYARLYHIATPSEKGYGKAIKVKDYELVRDKVIISGEVKS